MDENKTVRLAIWRFSLPTGTFVAECPLPLDSEDIEDVVAFMALIEKTIKRSIQSNACACPSVEAGDAMWVSHADDCPHREAAGSPMVDHKATERPHPPTARAEKEKP